MEGYLDQGVDPKRICFLAFTKKAANEAKARALQKFKLAEEDLVYFRTIHSLAFRQLGLSKKQVLQREHYKELGESLGIEIKGSQMLDDDINYGMASGDRLLFLEGLSRIKQVDLHDVWEEQQDDIDWWELERVSRALAAYKERRILLDFTDMLHMFCKHAYVPKFKVLFVDEAQDLSKSQWDVVNRIIENSEVAYVAGDDDQAIFRWAGADVDYFITLSGETSVLDTSYRTPRKVQDMANQIISSVRKRRPKDWAPRGDDGSIQFYNTPEEVDMSSGSWLVLARNGYMLRRLEEMCMAAGYSYDSISRSPRTSPALKAIKEWERRRKGQELSDESWKLISRYTNLKGRTISPEKLPIWHQAFDKINATERQYFIAARSRGESLVGDARVKISTIHGAKGGEADHVLLMTDMSKKSYDAMMYDGDDEARVFYVGCTRSKESLHIILPTTNLYYEL